MAKATIARRSAFLLGALLFVYVAVAYVAVPDTWRIVERKAAARPEMVTRTTAGIAGDPINLGLVGPRAEVLNVFHAAGWRPADPLTLRTAVEIGLDVVLDRPYADAPVSTLLFEGRPQDLAFEKPIGASPDMRHHVRLWQMPEPDLWFGAATLDRGIGVSHDTGQITHHIAPDIDAERDLILHDLAAAGAVISSYAVPGIGETDKGRNGGGDPYFTDGRATVVELGTPSPD